MNWAVLGGGGWGTAMAQLLARKGHLTWLWVRNPERAEELRRLRENRPYLPGVPLPPELRITADLTRAVGEADVLLFAVPSFAMRDTARRAHLALASHVPTAAVSLAKGLERETLRTMTEVLAEEVPGVPVFALSGPSHAEEVGRDEPTAVVLAGRDQALGAQLQRTLLTDRFRVYLTDDVRGVEYGATVKNVIALAAGISDGLGYGDNAKAALVARGLAEMVRLGVKLGCRPETLYGLSGLGDLVVTCTSRHSRNRAVGERLGRGEKLGEILTGMAMVAEGVFAAPVVRALAHAHGVEMPITEAVCAVLDGASPREKLDELMLRPPKAEGE